MNYEPCDWHFHWEDKYGASKDLRLYETVIEMAYDLAYLEGWKPKKWYKPWTYNNWVKCSRKTKHRIISDMCYCVRHDYGILKLDGALESGMTKEERKALYAEMESVYNRCIEPYMEIKSDT